MSNWEYNPCQDTSSTELRVIGMDYYVWPPFCETCGNRMQIFKSGNAYCRSCWNKKREADPGWLRGLIEAILRSKMDDAKKNQLLEWCRRMDDILKAALEGNEPPDAGQQFHRLLDDVENGLRDELENHPGSASKTQLP